MTNLDELTDRLSCGPRKIETSLSHFPRHHEAEKLRWFGKFLFRQFNLEKGIVALQQRLESKGKILFVLITWKKGKTPHNATKRLFK